MPTFSLSERNTRLPYECSHLNIEGRTLYYVDARQCATVSRIGPCYYCGHGGEVPGGRWVARHIVCEPCAVDYGAPRECDEATFSAATDARNRPLILSMHEFAPLLFESVPGVTITGETSTMPPEGTYTPRSRMRDIVGTGFKEAKPLPLP
jgi:hypothetical protein